jgi:hypothetical protein
VKESRFAALAGRDGGRKRADAVQAAENRVASMEGDYIAEADRLIAQLNVLSGATGPDIEAIYRTAATLRGLGGAFGYVLVSEVAGSLCDLTERLGSAGQMDRPALLAHAQSLTLLHHRRVKGNGGDGEAQLCEGLAKLVARWPAAPLP